VLGLVAGNLASVLLMLRGTALLRSSEWAWKRLWVAFRRYRKFPQVLLVAGFINVLGIQLPVILISALFGSQDAGWLGLTQRVLALPVSLIGLSVAQVYLSVFAPAAKTDPIRAMQLFTVTSRRLALIAVPFVLVLMALGPKMFSLIFSSEWEMSGSFARALSLSLAMQLIVVPLGQVLVVYERLGIQLLCDSFRLVAIAVSIVATYSLGGSAEACAWALSFAGVMSYGLAWGLSMRELKRRQTQRNGQA
jgi:O-antigen/teichoic acid export membrane protein